MIWIWCWISAGDATPVCRGVVREPEASSKITEKILNSAGRKRGARERRKGEKGKREIKSEGRIDRLPYSPIPLFPYSLILLFPS
jgi:hypothetical protein